MHDGRRVFLTAVTGWINGPPKEEESESANQRDRERTMREYAPPRTRSGGKAALTALSRALEPLRQPRTGQEYLPPVTNRELQEVAVEAAELLNRVDPDALDDLPEDIRLAFEQFRRSTERVSGKLPDVDEDAEPLDLVDALSEAVRLLRSADAEELGDLGVKARELRTAFEQSDREALAETLNLNRLRQMRQEVSRLRGRVENGELVRRPGSGGRQYAEIRPYHET